MKQKLLLIATLLVVTTAQTMAEVKNFGSSTTKTWTATSSDGCSSGSTITLDGVEVTMGNSEDTQTSWSWHEGNGGLIPTQMPSTDGTTSTLVTTFTETSPFGTLPTRGNFFKIVPSKNAYIAFSAKESAMDDQKMVLVTTSDGSTVTAASVKARASVCTYFVEAGKTYYFFQLAYPNQLTGYRYTLKSVSVNPTTLMTNADFQANSGGSSGTPTGWTLTTSVYTTKTSNGEKGGGTIAGNPNNHWQIWNDKAMTGKAYQTITNLPNGIYTVSTTLVCDFNGRVKLYAGNNSKAVTSGSYGTYSVDAAVTAGTLELGLDFTVTSGSPDLEIDDFTLTYKEALGSYNGEVNLNELDAAAQTAIDNVNVTLTRTLVADKWNTFCVPFNAAIPEGWTVKEFSSAADNVYSFTDASTIVAGQPYIVKPNSDAVNPVFDNVNITATEGTAQGGGDYKFVGQLYNKELDTDGTIAYLTADGIVKKLTSGGIKGMRAYFQIPPSSGAEVKLFIDGMETSVNEIANSKSANNECFDLSGRRISNPNRGINIVNGKKVLVK
ncbi:MAG: DUF5013 domain-containing protein [Bacteroidaceae bacterium]|nr:DUF5013 domain-containing protein [Bacteroidaceae bacterium]